MLKIVMTRPIRIDGQVVAPPIWAKLRPNTMARQMPDNKIITAQITSFLNICTFKGTATFPQIMSSG